MKKKIDYEILYEDDAIVVVNKPAGVFSIPDRYDWEAANLQGILREKYGEIFVVHRLDRGTSGVMVFAKNADAHRELNTQFQEHKVSKLYHVVIAGILARDELDIDIPLMPSPVKKGLTIPSVRGKESLTRVRVVERFRAATLIECDLVTGRHHQIRAHCSAIGHPLMVDPDYGGAENFLLSTIKRRYNLKKNDVERPLISRITMHAHSISFIHPQSGEKVSYEADYPKDFRAMLQTLRKYSAVPDFMSDLEEEGFF